MVLLACGVPLGAEAPAAGDMPENLQPYSARYAVYRNGKLSARAEFMLQQQGAGWIHKSESIGTHGMARFLKFRDYEYVEGFLANGSFRPTRYEHELKWLGPDRSTVAEFDWEAGEVTVSSDEGTVTLELEPGALDPMTLHLEMRKRLSAPDPRLEFLLVEEDEIELQRFRTLPAERLETSLGCLDTTPVEKVREGSTRFTRAWHAGALDHIVVRMEHGKPDGDQMELRITELIIDGKTIEPKPGCAAQQG